MSVKALNDFVGAIMLAGMIALVTAVLWSRDSIGEINGRLKALEQMQDQQLRINESVAKLSETVAVLVDRGERK